MPKKIGYLPTQNRPSISTGGSLNSPQVKVRPWLLYFIKTIVYELPHKFMNYSRFRIFGN